VSEYVADFVQELQCLPETGLTCNNNHLTIHIDCFVCDAPARAFIKNIKGHGGYRGCEKCVQEGVYINNRMIFPEIRARLRTYDEFESLADEGNHRGRSPLCVLRVGLVTGFVYDYMHLVCLGVMRKLIKFWQGGTLYSGEMLQVVSLRTIYSCCLKNFQCFLAAYHVSLHGCREQSPTSIDGKRLSSDYFYCTLVQYLAGVLSQNVYDHFMLLIVGITLLISPVYCQVYNDYAH